jgi:hypothetical protein
MGVATVSDAASLAVVRQDRWDLCFALKESLCRSGKKQQRFLQT